MKTEVIKIDSQGNSIERAVTMTEELAENSGLDRKQCLHLRLLAEELLGMIRSIAGEVDAEFYVVKDDRNYQLILESEMEITKERKKNFLIASTQGVNSAAKGFMGSLRDFIATALLPREDSPSGLSMGLMSFGAPGGYGSDGSYNWSMTQYAEAVKHEDGSAAKEAWDQLEKSIVASIADDVSVYIKNPHVKMVITKNF